MAGVKLDNNTANTNKANGGKKNDVKTYEFTDCHENEGTVMRRSCTAMTTTKRTMTRKDVKSVEFSETLAKMRSITALVAGAALRQRHTKPEKNRLEMFVRTGTTLI